MKALVVHPYMSVLGGGEHVCLNIVKALVEDGHDVILVSEPIDRYKLEGFFDVSTLKSVTQIPYEIFKPKIKKFSVYQRILHHELMKNKFKNEVGTPDLEILTQDVFFLFNVGKKKIAYVHYPEYLVHLEEASLKSRWFWMAYYLPILWYTHQKIRTVDLFLCNSEYTKRATKEMWGKEALVVYPPVDVEDIRPVRKEEFVVTVGRFVRNKNYEMLIEVAKLMPHVQFVIVGRKQDVNYYERIRRLKPANVILLPDLSRAELISMLSRAKVYLHTMVGEHFGISIVEAMAAGCVPIVHNSGGARYIVSKIGYAYNNVSECIEYIQRALFENTDISRIVENSKEFNSENFRRQVKKILKENSL